MKIIITICIVLLIFNDLFSQSLSPTINEKPMYTSAEFVSFEKMYNIDIDKYDEFLIPYVSHMAVDEKGYLYVLAIAEHKIFVFDNNGKFIKEMGGLGQGPRELTKPISLFINQNKIYIFEAMHGIKIWDLDGNYLDYILVSRNNNLSCLFRPYNDEIISVMTEIDVSPRSPKEMISAPLFFRLKRFSSEMKLINSIAELKVDPTKNISFTYTESVPIDSDGNVYFPENLDTYLINKYDLDGNKIVSFGRVYKREKYSDKMQKWLYDNYAKKGSDMHFPKFSPIIRHLIVDDYDMVWAVVGEWYQDNYGYYKFNSTIDIFDKNGKWLYTFKSNKFSRRSFIKNGFLYSQPIPIMVGLSDEGDNISVYKINYNFNKNNEEK